jgi:hypothetical protein
MFCSKTLACAVGAAVMGLKWLAMVRPCPLSRFMELTELRRSSKHAWLAAGRKFDGGGDACHGDTRSGDAGRNASACLPWFREAVDSPDTCDARDPRDPRDSGVCAASPSSSTRGKLV